MDNLRKSDSSSLVANKLAEIPVNNSNLAAANINLQLPNGISANYFQKICTLLSLVLNFESSIPHISLTLIS